MTPPAPDPAAGPAAGPPYGLIAGNGRFPFLIIEAAKSRGIPLIVAAIREETFPEI
ncbi:MAG: LpxI family protein, partial [Terriglobales bacterium]